MNTLLIFFALPVATIILAIVLQKILRFAFLTAATFFAIAYTIIAFITAFIAEFFFERCEENRRRCCNCKCCRNNCNWSINGVSLANNAIPTATIVSQNQAGCSCGNNSNTRPNTVAVNVRDSNNMSNNSSWCCYRR